jgi:hypothetical protein
MATQARRCDADAPRRPSVMGRCRDRRGGLRPGAPSELPTRQSQLRAKVARRAGRTIQPRFARSWLVRGESEIYIQRCVIQLRVAVLAHPRRQLRACLPLPYPQSGQVECFASSDPIFTWPNDIGLVPQAGSDGSFGDMIQPVNWTSSFLRRFFFFFTASSLPLVTAPASVSVPSAGLSDSS